MKSDREKREWLDDYMSLKQVNPTNPFTVPEGYFNELEQNITSYIKLDEFKTQGTQQGFAVPENYFEELSSNIQSRIFVEEALNIDTPGFAVPQDYFENLEQQIESRIFVEEALNEPANNFIVPEGYFNQLNQSILNKTANQPVKKQKGTIVRMFNSPAFKYATAACLTIAVGSAILFNQNNAINPMAAHDKTFLHQSLSSIPLNDIQSYLQTQLDESDKNSLMDDNDKQINNTQLNNDLQDYIDTTQ